MTWVGMLAPLLGEYAVTSRRPLRQFRLAGVAAGLAVYAEVRVGAVLGQLGPVGPDIGESGDELLRCRGGRLMHAGCHL